MTKAELLKTAKDGNVSVKPTMTKDELISAIETAAKKGAEKKSAAAKPAAKKASAAAKPAAAKKKSASAKPAAAAKKSAQAKAKAPTEKPAPKLLPAAKAKAKPLLLKAPEPEKVKPAPKAVDKPAAPAKVEAKPAPAPKAAPVVAEPAKAKAVAKPAAPAKVEAKPAPAPKAAPVVAEPAKAKAATKPATPAKVEAKPAPAPKAAPAAVAKPSKPGKPSGASGKFAIKPDAKKFFQATEQADYTSGPQSAAGPVETTLQQRYGETSIGAMVKGPGAIYVYWEVTEDRAEEALAAMGKHWSLVKWLVRIHDVTEIEAGRPESNLFYDFAVEGSAGALHADLPRAEREYIASIGLLDNEGKYFAIAYSGQVATPAPEAAQINAEGVSTLSLISVTPIPGSPSFDVGLTGQIGVEGMESGMLSGAGFSGAGFATFTKGQLWVNTELTIYGGAAPGSTIILGTREIHVGPEGFFTAKLSLPEGVTEIPVRVLSRKGSGAETDISISRTIRVNK
ncbi:MAG: DUF4912 domain-containing protein [Nitrospinota bacterium]|nr:DUF4912 domain-containing protein [Nitrospinota bacterium]